ncbi:MAG: hypothetical protein HUU09_00650 [Candidatus Jettenia caeni]|nr:hypothetical protein [Candidatus Jettenia sp. AMX1]MDL1938664.1 hypothetical protein [Candidatus Jettenia sp. AMX1]NUN21962.1 hypothetical protein [Candidatus Jettenia caeni]
MKRIHNLSLRWLFPKQSLSSFTKLRIKMAGISDKTTEDQELKKIGDKPVGIIGIASTMAYLIIFSGLLLYGIITLWPSRSNELNPDRTVTFLFSVFSIKIPNELCAILIVTLSGALGSLVHALRSFYKYVGNRELVWSWLAMYIMLPFIGATLGLLFYLIIRGGFFPHAETGETSPFGFMAMAALAGLFSEQAILKLKEVSETLLTKPEKGKDRITEKQMEGTSKEKQEDTKEKQQ